MLEVQALLLIVENHGERISIGAGLVEGVVWGMLTVEWPGPPRAAGWERWVTLGGIGERGLPAWSRCLPGKLICHLSSRLRLGHLKERLSSSSASSSSSERCGSNSSSSTSLSL